MKPVQRIAQTAALIVLMASHAFQSAAADTPITANASPETQSLLSFLSGVYGKKILSGQHESWRGTNGLGPDLAYILKVTGKLPAVLSLDLSACTQQAPRRDTNHITATIARDWYVHHGGIVTLCLHWHAPMDERAFYTKDTKFNLSVAMTEGTPEHAALLRDLDLVAEELKFLRDARVPVLWRPMHEMNGRWFWWGASGPEPFKKLWRLMFERFTRQHGLNNLLWVFSPGCETDLADWYPGDAYVDLIGQDHYPPPGDDGPAKDVFDELVNLGRGTKLVGMSENGPIPDPDRIVSEKADWLFFTTWSGTVLTNRNSDEKLKKVFNHPHVMNLNNLTYIKGYPFEPAGKASRLAFPAPPGDVATGGEWRLPITVAVQDRNGKTVRTSGTTVTLALAGKQSKENLTGTRTAKTVNGIATFDDLKINEAGRYKFSATANGLKSATSPAFEVGPGAGILWEWWTNSPAKTAEEISKLENPDGRQLLTKGFEVPVQSRTNYAARFRGVLTAPVSGEYTFSLANTMQSDLWLGKDSTPNARVKIVSVTPNTPYVKWPHINQSVSQPVSLEAGKSYYLELDQRQRGGSAQLFVSWTRPDGIIERPIPSFRFSPPATESSQTSSGNK